MKITKIITLLSLALFVFASCEKEEDKDPVISSKTGTLTLAFDGLADLGNDFMYEGWIMVDGAPVSTGTFSVDADGTLSKTVFSLTTDQVNKAGAFILTIEPFPDTDASPSKVHILAGDISSMEADLVVNHGAALGTDFSGSTGKYILATPTNGADNNENSGMWFLDPTSGTPVAGLDLPTLPEGWTYEGWSVIDGTPVTTGKFTALDAADASVPYSGTMQGPPFPGEDFLNNAPAGLSFPVDLSGSKVVISVEPVPDNSSAPFLLKPLLGDVPSAAMDHTAYMMGNISQDTNPTGSAKLAIQ